MKAMLDKKSEEEERREGEKWACVLYDLVMNKPEMLWFHVGNVISFEPTYESNFRKIRRYFSGDRVLTLKPHGGELLTRCRNINILPQYAIGPSFQYMPKIHMIDMLPSLVESQLKFIDRECVLEEGMYYSINMECMNQDLLAWGRICNLLIEYKHLPINIELKENALLSPPVMNMVKDVCEEANIGIYIDDLCSCCHKLPENEDYLIMMIEELHKYIEAVKIDFSVMKFILHLEEYHSVAENLHDFRWLWESWCDFPLPLVIFESFPDGKDRKWLERLEELADGFRGCRYQRG